MKLEQIRNRLDDLNWQLLIMLVERLFLVREVARQKKNAGDGVIHAPAREAAIFDQVTQQCQLLGLDQNFVLEIVSLLIAHAKDAECDVLGVDTFLDRRMMDDAQLRQNLLALTSISASDYGEVYCEGSDADAIRFYLSRENQLLLNAIQSIGDREVAVDLGCATGRMCESLEGNFNAVRAFDICPKMIQHARTRRAWRDGIWFQVSDLSECIPLEAKAVSFAVASFGSASEVCFHLWEELGRVLKSGGYAFLSFYNVDAISNLWYYPWPSTIRSHLNPFNRTLEVWYKGSVYTIRCEGMTADIIKNCCRQHALEIVWIESFPTLLSILPRFFFSSPRFQCLVEAVTELDRQLAISAPYRGTYLTALVRKL